MANFELPKSRTGIEGLDQILEGGLPSGRTSLVSGGPGCGKTVMGLQFICYGADHGEPGIYITFEEKKAAVRQNALTLGWNLERLEKKGLMLLLENTLPFEKVCSGEAGFEALLDTISEASGKIGAVRIVVDALDVLLSLFKDPEEERQGMLRLHQLFNACGMTALMTAKIPDGPVPAAYGFMDFHVDCAIQLDQRVIDQVTTRRLRVKKFRGSGFGRNEYPYSIGPGGVRILPISTLGLRHKPLGAFVSSGLEELDDVLGGGYRRASSVLIAGATGTGKTSMAATFAREVCGKGETLLYISFEESRQAMMSNMLSPGIDLQPAYESGSFRYISGLPEAMGAEEHLLRAFKEIETYQPDHIVVDAISACKRMGSEKAAFDYVVRLLNLAKERGITCLLLNQTVEASSIQERSGIEISSIIDAALSLHMTEETGEINRTLICLKSRGSKHSNQYREYLITDAGVELMAVYIGGGRVLTGTARKVLEEKEAAEALKLEQQIEERERELEYLKAARNTLKKGRAARAVSRGGERHE
ncbi:MAG: circadian clock protein KaiC [Desulfobacter sp.]